MRDTLGVWKTTILGGALFLLPFAVVVFLVGQLAAILFPVVEALKPYMPDTGIPLGIVSSATLLAILLLAALCYVAGVVAQRSLAARFAARFEKSLLLLFPRYAIWKNAMASNLGNPADALAMKPVLVTLEGAARVGFETCRTEGGLVSVYLPSAPDPWSGEVVHVAAERVAPLTAAFGAALAVREPLGRRSEAAAPAPPGADFPPPL